MPIAKFTGSINNLTALPMSGWTRTLRYLDMNAGTGGVARATSIATSANWTTAYLYTGTGSLFGMIMSLETMDGWEVRLQVDGSTVFSVSTDDLKDDQIYDLDEPLSLALGIGKGGHDQFRWTSPLYPVGYATSVRVEVRRPTAAAKRWRAGLIVLSQE